MINKVHILSVGYSRCDPLDSTSMKANCSSTLIKTYCGKNIIVDTMTAWDGDFIVKALKANSLEPDDINYVVCTHGHSDHIGCNYLFPNAKWHFVGSCMSHHDKYPDYDWEHPYSLVEGEVEIISTPGHTMNCISLLVNNTDFGGTVGVCGDLFENSQDVWDSQIWISAGSENQKMQKENRLKLAKLCSYIIPGHGEGFVVTDDIRNKLQQDCNEIL
ncbi:metallo-beta-lactamase domain-containing protein 1 [Lucilia cuprina]|uniref:metallo-beta-lactamase domain-containing protein 1 n=1 Tax=Lucilia cuprina TaxID=7375 RepID=UPI001F053C6D|nr:metallo-beta-lactamase domain-containing protein 1 [Lucilia cuprina]XP_046806117.1 metallo-beta-lactamase domain-containing protein 1 [Lucilia cuprina]